MYRDGDDNPDTAFCYKEKRRPKGNPKRPRRQVWTGVCKQCGIAKPKEDFWITPRHKTVTNVCKECHQRNMEKSIAKARNYIKNRGNGLERYTLKELLDEIARRDNEQSNIEG